MTTAEPQDTAEKKKEAEPDPREIEAVAHIRAGLQALNSSDNVTAEAEFRKAIECKSDFQDALYNLGVLLRDTGRVDEAKTTFQKIVDTQTRAAMAKNNLAILADWESRYEDALQWYRDGIEDAFQTPLFHFNMGMLLLKMGQYEEGWKECEWRWQTDSFTPLRCLQPRWRGRELDGTLLVHTEQGAGDTFQFMRFLPEIRKRCKHVLLICPDHLACMFRQGAWADEIRNPGEIELDRFLAYLPLMSAPYALQANDEKDFRVDGPYLDPEPREVDLGDSHVADAKLKVGIAWAGSPTHDNDAYRSMHAHQLAPILDVPGIAFYSLQKGDCRDQLSGLTTTSLRDLDGLQNDFADTAAIMRQLDMVISVDTSVLHLAGGLGVPAWGLLSSRSDWRWLLDRDDTSWYPKMRLFRQEKLNDWAELNARVAAELKAVVEGKPAL